MTSMDEYANSSETNIETCKLRFSSKKRTGKMPAILANFTNGKLRSDQQSKIKFECYSSAECPERDNKNIDRILLADNGRLQYTASNSENTSEIKYMIGVRNKKTDKMKLYDSVPFRLKPLMPTLNKNNVTDSPSAANKSYQERRDELTSHFGSKYGKRAMTSRIKYTTAAEDLAPIANVIEEMPIEDKPPKVIPMTPVSSEIIPPKNLDVKDIERVYSISSIISDEEMDALHVEASEVSAASDELISQWKVENRYCNYCIHHIEKQQLSLDRYKLLIYFNYMTSFFKLTYKDIKKKDVAVCIPEPFKENLLKNYTITSRQENGRLTRNFPLSMKDKILAFALVLALFIDDFSVNLTMVQNDMKVAVSKIIRIAQVLGCHVTNKKVGDSLVKFANLKFPLYIATEKRYAKKK